MQTHRLFVYGTLRRGRYAHDLIANHGGVFLGEARSTKDYSLLDMVSFPGMVETPGEGFGVSGEVFEIPESAFPGLDRYEGVAVGLFHRGTVALEDGTEAVAYFYGRDWLPSDISETGVWR